MDHLERDHIFTFSSETTILIILTLIIGLSSLFFLSYLTVNSTIIIYKILINPDFYVSSTSQGKYIILLPAVILMGSIGVYFLKPWITIRTNNLIDLNRKYPELETFIRDSAKNIGLNKKFKVLYSNSIKIDIFTMGHIFNNYLVVSEGFIKKFSEKPNEFQAIIYHEFGHISSDDPKRIELVISLLNLINPLIIFNLSFLAINGIIIATGSLVSYDTSSIEQIIKYFTDSLILGFFFIFIIIILHYLIHLILRTREFYADAYAIQHLAGESDLIDTLSRFEAIASITKRRLAFLSVEKIFAFLRTHPMISERKDFAKNPIKFFDFRGYLPFILGIYSGFFFLFSGLVLPHTLAQQITSVVLMFGILTFFSYLIIRLNFVPFLMVGQPHLQKKFPLIRVSLFFSLGFCIVVASFFALGFATFWYFVPFANQFSISPMKNLNENSMKYHSTVSGYINFNLVLILISLVLGIILASFLIVSKLCVRKVPLSSIGTRTSKFYMDILPLILNLMILSSIFINVFLFFVMVILILIFAIFLFYKKNI